MTLHCFLLLSLAVLGILVCYCVESSRIGRAWMEIFDDEMAALALGVNTRNLKLLAFGMGVTFGGVFGVMFAAP